MSVEFLGVAYLFYMSWNILRDGGALNISGDDTKTSSWRIAINGTFGLLGLRLALSER